MTPDISPQPRRNFTARYLVESFEPLARAAEVLAGEQSCGTFMALPGETDELRARARAEVVSVEALETVTTPALPDAYADRRGITGPYYRGIVTVSFPVDNVGANLPALWTTVAGNLFELGELTGLRLLDIDLPADYAAQFPGPAFGVTGTRRLTGVTDRPLIGTIIKPSIGLLPDETAALVASLCQAGIDFIKDDELTISPAYAPFDARVRAVMRIIREHADRTGKMVMYAFNLSGDVDDMRRDHDLVLAEGGTCVMASLNWTGPAAITALRRHSQLPVHGHRNGFGALNRAPSLGFDFQAYQKLWRLAGVDQLHVNGLMSKFWEPDDSVALSARGLLQPFAGTPAIMPVFSSGQTAAHPPATLKAVKSADLIFLAGGGIIGHPDGVAAGVTSLRDAWQAAIEGVDLAEYARTRPALAHALAAFGERAT